MNTKEKGIIRFLICKEGKDLVAVCLDLNIIEYGKNLDDLKNSIEEAAQSYLDTVRSENLSDDFLNQTAPEKYWKKWETLQKRSLIRNTPKKSRLTEVSTDSNCLFRALMQTYNHNFGHC